MKKHPKDVEKEIGLAAAGWALLVIAIEVITELTGIRKYNLSPDPKSPLEVLQDWPIFLLSGLATFLAVYFWKIRRLTGR